MFVLIITRRGVNEGVRTGTEAEVKSRFPDVVWQDFGYKQSAHLTEYVSLDLFNVS